MHLHLSFWQLLADKNGNVRLTYSQRGHGSVDFQTWNRRPEMLKFLKLIKDEKGATAIEYGLIAALIAVAAVTAMGSLGQTIGNTFNNVSNAMEG
jgi:pilus assembly protein Flp/PilA